MPLTATDSTVKLAPEAECYELLVAGERPTLCSLRRLEFRDVEMLLAHRAEQGRLPLERERVGESRGLLVEEGGLTVGAASRRRTGAKIAR